MTLEIPLNHGKVALIDEEDAELVGLFNWYVDTKKLWGGRETYYARASVWNPEEKRQHCIYMHQVVMGRMLVDHKNGDGLRNTRGNLRPCTPQQNAANKGPQGGSSKFKGVTLKKDAYRRRPWQARIKLNGKTKYLGCFETELEAAKRYNEAAIEHFGEFAWLNPIPDA